MAGDPISQVLPRESSALPGGRAGFRPAVSTWFARRFPDGPTEPQSRGWPLIASGLDTLIAAPTGSGKTLAGFLVAIDSLYRAHAAGQDVSSATRIVYVSLLKALAVDIAQNLERPLAEIAAVAVEMGLAPAPISVAVRTGDTSASQRAQMLRRRPNLIVTTQESLYLLLTSTRRREMLATVETVIVDEIHAVARDKRGAHLALSPERLEALCGHHPVRIRLSAQQRPIEVVGRLLVGDRPLPAVVDVGHRRDLDLALELASGSSRRLPRPNRSATCWIASPFSSASTAPRWSSSIPGAWQNASLPARRAAGRGGRLSRPRQSVEGASAASRDAPAGR